MRRRKEEARGGDRLNGRGKGGVRNNTQVTWVMSKCDAVTKTGKAKRGTDIKENRLIQTWTR